VAEARGIQKKGAGGIVAVFVGEDTVENQDLLALRMPVLMEGGVRVIAHDRGDAAEFAIDQIQALAPDCGAGACLPLHLRRVHGGRTAEIRIEAVAHSASSRYLPLGR
jgi:hypothetical protein